MEENERTEYEQFKIEEKNEYLEGKIYVLQRNSKAREKELEHERKKIKEERIKMGRRAEEMKSEIVKLKEELREERAERRIVKKVKEEKNEKEKENENINKSVSVNIKSQSQNQLPIEWILSHLKGEVLFDLSGLSPGKLKIFGRFFKREFDSLYERNEVIRSIEGGAKNTKHLIKCLLYLSDRPEIVGHFIPYVFMSHIVPDGKVYIKEIVHILYRVGVASFLQSTDTIEDVKNFFNECRHSEDLLYLLETLAQKSPRSVARLISAEYIIGVSGMYKETARRIVGLLDGCGAFTRSSEAVISLYGGCEYFPYESPSKEMVFFL